jgi:hypothetical protein
MSALSVAKSLAVLFFVPATYIRHDPLTQSVNPFILNIHVRQVYFKVNISTLFRCSLLCACYLYKARSFNPISQPFHSQHQTVSLLLFQYILFISSAQLQSDK